MAEQLALTRPGRSGLTTDPNRTVRQAIPAFLSKLFAMVTDPTTNDLIHWSDEGDSFFVPNHERFGKELLPRFFKHSNFSSFVRQLNMYGFHKVPHLQQGVLQNETENELWQFVSPHFQRGQPDLLLLMQRKKAGNAPQAIAPPPEDVSGTPNHSAPVASGHGTGHVTPGRPSDNRAIDVSGIASSLAAIKRHQSAISDELKDLRQSNTTLWQEAGAARERHEKHQDTINRILKFLAGVFGNGAGAAGVHGGSVREHDEESLPRTSSESASGTPSTALVPRKRPRLMIEDSGSGSDVRPPSSRNVKQHAVPLTAAQLEEAEDDAWADEHLLVPMDTDELNAMSSAWRENTGPRIESVPPSSAATSVPPTPRFPPSQAEPSNGRSGPSQTDYPFPGQGNNMTTSSEVFPYDASTPNQSGALIAGSTPTAGGSGNDMTADQTLQALLSASPGSFQRLMSTMSQPGGLPVMPPPQTDFGGQSMPYNNFAPGDFVNNNNVGSYPQNNQASSNGLSNGQLVPAASNPFAFLSQPSGTYGPPGGFDPSQSNSTLSPEDVMALLSSQPSGSGAGGYIANEAGPSQQDVAQSLNSYTNSLNRTYTDASAINAEVDALQQSINSLIESIGLDPVTMSQLHENNGAPNQGGGVGVTQEQQQAAYSELLNSFPQGSAQPDFEMFDPQQAPPMVTVEGGGNTQSDHHTQEAIVDLDDLKTSSTVSTPTMENFDDKATLPAAPRVRSSKRKSEVVESDSGGGPALGKPKPRKSNRKK